MNSTRSKIAAAATIIAMITALAAGCAGNANGTVGQTGMDTTQTGASPAETSSSPANTSKPKLAESFKEYAARQLVYAQRGQNPEWQTSDAQLEILRRIVDTGTVTPGDYARAWSNYTSCVTAKGDPEPVLIRYANGMISQAAIDGASMKGNNSYASCEWKETNYVDLLYGILIGNPNLYQDPDEAIVDCLHKANVVPMSYTAKDYAKDSKDLKFPSFDRLDPNVRSCQIANNVQIVYLDVDPVQTFD